jgi:elongator complex protein 2
MTDAAWLSGLRFASGADEKVTRVFDAPAGFVESLGTLGVASSRTEEVDAVRGAKRSVNRNMKLMYIRQVGQRERRFRLWGFQIGLWAKVCSVVRRATINARAERVIAPDEPETPGAHVPNPSHDSISRALTSFPTEEELASSTLWPEVEKIYGHGYEAS